MNILLTGGLGYIGSHTAVVLAQAGHRVVLLDNLSNSRADVADRIGRIIGLRPVVEVADVLDTARVRHILSHYAIGVIHFAVQQRRLKQARATLVHPEIFITI